MSTYITTSTRGRKHLVPDVASDTFALIGATQTLTNKTLSSPIILNEPVTTANIGTKTGSTVTVVEKGNGIQHQSVFTFAATPLAITDTTPLVGGGSTLFYTFPTGRILIQGTTATMTFTTTSTIASTLKASKNCVWSVGSIAAAATGGAGTLTAGEITYLPSTACVSSATINVANTATGGALAASAQYDGTTTPAPAYLNFMVVTATDIDGNATIAANGTVTISWTYLGTY